MIATTDIANILYLACKTFGMPVCQGGNIPKGEVGEEGRTVIHPHEQTPGTHWSKCFVEVNLHAADSLHGNADLRRLNDLEREAKRILPCTDEFDGTPYRIEIASTRILSDEQLKSHYVNVKVLFKTLNTMEDYD